MLHLELDSESSFLRDWLEMAENGRRLRRSGMSFRTEFIIIDFGTVLRRRSFTWIIDLLPQWVSTCLSRFLAGLEAGWFEDFNEVIRIFKSFWDFFS
jgi:hypothetical protein